MNNRIKVGDVYLDLPEGALRGRPPTVAEKPETPAAPSPVAFASTEPDLVAQYIAHTVNGNGLQAVKEAPEPELDQMTEWKAFAGEKSEFPQQWMRFVKGKKKHCGFNNWAFLFGFQWFLFHKLYGKALLFVALEALVLIIPIFCIKLVHEAAGVLPPGPLELSIILSVGILAPRFFAGYWSGIVLLRKAQREIGRVRAFRTDNTRKLAMIREAGSSGVVSLVVLYLAVLAVRIIVGGH